MSIHRVLVTDGELHYALAVLRSLGKMGIQSTVIAEHKSAISFFSKYCKNTVLFPSSKSSPNHLIRTIERIVKRGKFETLFPMGSWSVHCVSKYRDKITPYVRLPLASHESVTKAFDKSVTLKLAENEGIPIPKTFLVSNASELKKAAEKVAYLAVIKPRRPWIWQRSEALSGRPIYVNSTAELLSLYPKLHQIFPFPLVQEYIPGVNYSIGALCNDSQIKAICGIKVHRTMPVTGGNSTFRESVRLDPNMKDYASRLLKALDWYGIAEVEFRMDSRDSIPKLMEINGRFWGSLQVAISSGVDFPYLLYRLVTEGDIQPVLNHKVGIKGRWLGEDIYHLISVLRRSSSNCCVGYPSSKWRTLMDFLKFYHTHMEYDCFSLEDPLPFFSRFSRALGTVRKSLDFHGKDCMAVNI